jgi:hypothetical protein
VGGPMACWRGAALRVLAALVVLVAAPPSSAAVGAAAPPPPPHADMALLVARLERLEAAVRGQAREMREARADARALERRVAELEAERRGEWRDAGEGERQQPDEPRRRLQAAPNNTGKVVHIHKATVSIPEGPGWGISPNYNGGHRRRSLQNGAQCRNMAAQAQQVQARCCDDPTEDCSGGYPRTCNTGCAAVFLPFWAECGSLLGNAVVYQQTVALCQQAQPASPGSSSLAHEFNLVCADGATDGCVPACAAPLRGDLLLLNLNGSDSKYSCELHHGLHSWVGAATDGGYLGSDAQAFEPAVLSGAAGYYALALTADAGIGTDLTIQPGQNVKIDGEPSLSMPPSWGTGSFTVAERTTLSLSNLALSYSNTITFAGNGSTVSLVSMELPNGAWLNSLLNSMKTRAETTLKLSKIGGGQGSNTVTSNGHGTLSYSGTDGIFAVVLGPCSTSQGGRCVGRRYSEQEPWPGTILDGDPGRGIPGRGAGWSSGGGWTHEGVPTYGEEELIVERCEIVVLGAGALTRSPLFDTVSYGPNPNGNGGFNARHDAVGLGGANCAPAGCTGDSSGSHNCYVNSIFNLPDPPAPGGCYAGAGGPPPGTVLVAGETLTWAAAGDASNAYSMGHDCYGANAVCHGDSSNRASAHGGWELCFA